MSTVQYHLEELAIAKSQTDLRKALPDLPARFASILDIGCGAGQTLLACNLSPDVLACGIDIDAEAVAFGQKMDRESNHKNKGQLNLSCAVGEALPFADASFEVVISRVAVPYMHIPTAVTEIARVLTPGGHLWLTLHPFQMVFDFLQRAIQSGNAKSMIYFSYALLNGAAFHCFGKLWRFPLNQQRCESFQTAGAMQRALRQAGFAQVEMEQAPNRFAIKAIKA
jgi:ubiquinone/menaquinone biosynthesis C-methylase UbiE